MTTDNTLTREGTVVPLKQNLWSHTPTSGVRGLTTEGLHWKYVTITIHYGLVLPSNLSMSLPSHSGLYSTITITGRITRQTYPQHLEQAGPHPHFIKDYICK